MYKLTMINAEFGQVLNEEGNLYPKGTKAFHPEFDSKRDALLEKDRLLNKFIYAKVLIEDTYSGESSQEYQNELLGPIFLKEKRELKQWLNLPFWKKLFVNKPKCRFYDGKH